MSFHLIITTTLFSRHSYHHLADKKTEAEMWLVWENLEKSQPALTLETSLVAAILISQGEK